MVVSFTKCRVFVVVKNMCNKKRDLNGDFSQSKSLLWHARRDSNPQHSEPETVKIPNANRHFENKK